MAAAVVVLAGGYGTRLARDLEESTQFTSLRGLPKPLLPVNAKRPLLDDWLEILLDCRARGIELHHFFIVTNAVYFDKFVAWAGQHGIAATNIINDGTRTNDGRLGAIADLALVIEQKREQLEHKDLIVIAGDTLFYESFHLPTFLLSRRRDGDHVLYYRIQTDAEVSKRGILELDETTGRVCNFLEKPQPNQTTSRWACPAFYVFRHGTKDLILSYVQQAHQANDREALDAPGRLIGWLHKVTDVYGTQIEGRYDIGSLADYQIAVCPELVIERAFARIGLIGNPSDGFYGKTISVAIRNFYAVVCLRPSKSMIIKPNQRFDAHEFQNLGDLANRTSLFGYYGGLRLLRATCKRFFDLVQQRAPHLVEQINQRNFTMSYDSNIPFAVGLAGSSAIVTAALRALFHFYKISPSVLGLQRAQMPNIVLAIEREELGITAGLQDRVIQEYEGVVHMDFNKAIVDVNGGADRYTQLDPADLPVLYLAYMIQAGGESGKVHSDVRRRWEAGESAVVEGMKEFAALADETAAALNKHNYETLCRLMDVNFDLRRKLYGDTVTGSENILLVEAARNLGLSAKFTGSGGAFVLLNRGTNHNLASFELTTEQEQNVREKFNELGFAFARVKVQKAGDALRWE